MGKAAAVEIVPATLERFDDVRDLLGANGEAGCWCQAWRGFDAKRFSGGKSRPELLREQMQREPPPGFIAYLEGVPVGWIGVGVRTETPRLMNARTIPLVDQQPVWAIGCFRIRPGYRRRGIATALLAGLIEEARRVGAPGIEAYPIDPQGRRLDAGFAYVGIVSMFDAAGFRRVLVTKGHSAGLPRLLVRLDLPKAETASPPT
jgi:GNAT superfamily N-acetyltransferase